MSDDRLPTSLWVDAHLAQLSARGIPYYILNKGPEDSGIVLLKLFAPAERECCLLIQQRNFEGVMGWMHALGQNSVEERKADEYIARAIVRDPDLWVIEIEDAQMHNPFEGKIFE